MTSKGNINIGNGYGRKKKNYFAPSTSSYCPPFDYAKFEKVSRPVGKVPTYAEMKKRGINILNRLLGRGTRRGRGRRGSRW